MNIAEKNRNHIRNRKDRDVAAAFVISCLAMYLFCVATSLLGGGSTLLAGDQIELYVPAARSLMRSILNGDRIDYAWHLSLGMNATGYYATFAGGSLTNLLYLLFPAMEMETFVCLTLVTKAGLAGACFTLFAKRVLKTEGLTAILFSVFYALCGFQAAINIMNYIWMDAVYLLPLVLTYLVAFLTEKKWAKLVLVYAYLFLTNFYMGYIVGMFSAVFLLLYFFLFCQRREGKRLILFGLCVVLAAGLTAFILVPTALFIFTQNPPDATADEALKVNIGRLLSRFSFGVRWVSDVKYPYLYCGLPTLLLLTAYFFNREIEKKEKLLYGLLFSGMLLSCMVLPLYIFWHGFDVPDGWYFRFAFIISFLCTAMACREAGCFRQKSMKQFLLAALAEVGAGLGIALYCKWQSGSADPKLWGMNIGIALAWVGFALVFLRMKEPNRKKWLVFGVALAVLEVVCNGCLEHQIYQSKAEMDIWCAESQEAVDVLREDGGFHRINYVNSLLINADSCFGYNGVSDFGTFENYRVRKALENLGAYTSTRVTAAYGLNPFTQMLLNVKYDIFASGSSETETMGAALGQYPRYLQLGFLVPDQVRAFSFPGENVFENTNALAASMGGFPVEIFRETPPERITVEENGISLVKEDGWYELHNVTEGREVASILYQVQKADTEVYAAFDCISKGIREDRARIYEPYKPRDYGYLGVKYTKKLDDFGDYLGAMLVMRNGVTRAADNYQEAQFYDLDDAELEKLYRVLSENQLAVSAYRNGYVKGKVSVPGADRILFTTIPYDRGWKVKTDRGEAEVIPLLDGAFLGVGFADAGEYELVFTYEAPGAKIGLWISLLSLVVFLLCLRKGSAGTGRSAGAEKEAAEAEKAGSDG